MSDGKALCLTLDLEDDWNIDEPGFDHLTLDRLVDFVALVTDLKLPLSIFVVGRTLEQHPGAIHRLESALDCEFHLHSYRHDPAGTQDLRTEVREGKRAFRAHFGTDPAGYRAPLGRISTDGFEILEQEGFTFDSSVFPSYRPGVYNNLDAPIRPFIPQNVSELIEVPIGATLYTRIPLGHSYLKLLGEPFLQYLRVCPLPETIVYNVHLHDLYRTASHDQLPAAKRAIYARNMDRSEELLRDVIEIFRHRRYSPTTVSRLVEESEVDRAVPRTPQEGS